MDKIQGKVPNWKFISLKANHKCSNYDSRRSFIFFMFPPCPQPSRDENGLLGTRKVDQKQNYNGINSQTQCNAWHMMHAINS